MNNYVCVTANCQLPTANCQLPTANCPQLPVSSRILPPLFNHTFHITWQRAFKIHLLSCKRVNKTQLLGMQGMPGAQRKTILHELLVFCKHRSLYNFIPAVKIIIKNRMPDGLHMNPYLVCTPCLQPAFYKGYIIKSFKNPVMSNGFFAMLTIRV